MDIVYAIIIGFLAGYAVFKDILHYQERQKLQEKLMAKDFTEYKAATQPIAPEDRVNTIAEPDRTVPIDEADNPFTHGRNIAFKT